MVYKTPSEHFLRCAFPRGRLLSQVEDDLAILTQLIARFSPTTKDRFDELIDKEYARLRSAKTKTIRNYRTEMTKLFGLTVVGDDDMVEPSSRTSTLIDSQNFPLFFKSFCNRFQFPNCINKPQETAKQIQAGVKFKPAKFILELFLIGTKKCGKEFAINGNEISNLVFNDLRVTTGTINPAKVLGLLLKLRRGKVHFAGGSKLVQHGREFLGYMMLGKLLKQNGRDFSINLSERPAINFILKNEDFFEIPAEYTTDRETRKSKQLEWSFWYGEMGGLEKSKLAVSVPMAPAEKLGISEEEAAELALPGREELKEIGDKGERIVLKYEKEKIKYIRPDKLGLIKIVSNDAELGYDIQSLEFSDIGKKKFIEVKTTERTFPPAVEVLTYFPMSSNEWETARNQGDSYYIYRVFLTSTDSKIFIIRNPVKKERAGYIILEPLKYRVVVKKQAGNYIE